LLLEKEMAWNLINVAAYIVPWISGIDSFLKEKKNKKGLWNLMI